MGQCKVIHFSGKTRVPRITPVLQAQEAECGLACIAMIANAFGVHVSLQRLRETQGTFSRGMTLRDIVSVLDRFGIDTEGSRIGSEAISQAKTPCIAHWEGNHFVVIERVKRRSITIVDPRSGRCEVSRSSFSRQYTGVVLEVSGLRARESEAVQPSGSWLRNAVAVPGLRRSLALVAALAIAVEVVALAFPLHVQWTVDRIIPGRNEQIIPVVATVFLAAAALYGLLSVVRAQVVSWLGASLTYTWTSSVLAHLFRLPASFFFNRALGDIVSRVSSTRSVQAIFTGNFIEAVLDGVFGAVVLVVLVIYSWKIAALVVLIASLYALLRWAQLRKIKDLHERRLRENARWQSELMMTALAVDAIKTARRVGLRTRVIDEITRSIAILDMRIQRLSAWMNAVSRTLMFSQRVVLVSAIAFLVFRSQFTLGMGLACMVFADQFITRVSALSDRLTEFGVLRVHVERISDITDSVEENVGSAVAQVNVQPSIELKNVGFRFNEASPWVFQGLNLKVEAGESVAITGPSGCGKSTLLRIIAGVLSPTEGEISVGGVPLEMLGLDNYRRLIAVVFQNDQLLPGTIADNITLWDEQHDYTRVVSAAKAAAIHEDIVGMPMGYSTILGDLASQISGGQRQRLMLARALYSNPQILLLDEATSSLDPAREQVICREIKALTATRIVVAHRAETIATCDRVVDLEAQLTCSRILDVARVPEFSGRSI